MTTASSAARRRYPLHIYIGVLFTALVLVTGTVIAAVDYVNARKMVLDAISDLFESSARETLAELRANHEPIRTLVVQLAQRPNTASGGPRGQLSSLQLMRRALDLSPMLSAIYVGFAEGGLFYIRRLDFAAAQRDQHAPTRAAYMVQLSETSGRGNSVSFYDEDMKLLSTRAADLHRPREMIWFESALKQSGLIRTPAFLLPSRDIGFAIAQATPDGRAVIGADLALKDLSASLSRQRASPSAQVALADPQGRVLAASHGAWRVAEDLPVQLPTLTSLDMPILAKAFAAAPSVPGARTLSSNGRDWETLVVTAGLADGEPLYLVMAAPHDELLAGVRTLRLYALASILAVLLVAIPLTWWIARRISLDLRNLASDARAIRHFRFDGRDVQSFVLEVDDLAQAMAGMRSTVRQFLDIASQLSAERHFTSLLDGLIFQTVAASQADAGAVYLMDDAGANLVPSAWQHVALDRLLTEPPAVPVVDAEPGHPLSDACHSKCMHIGQLSAIGMPADLGWLAARFPGQSVSFLAVPLSNREDKVIGVLFLAKSAVEFGFTSEQAAFVNALSGTLAVAIDNQRLMRAQKALLDAVIRVVAGAIDAKSPYTGGHCQRVPELTLMLAEAACQSNAGPFRDFRLDEDEWEALSIAAWLHDCGKLTTPEYVVDKATKLETLADRIHEIRTRFEVLKRDVEINYWRGIAGGGDPGALGAIMQDALLALDDDFAFVAACNIGGEALPEGAEDRLRQIATRTWRRTLDDRLGISQLEKQRKERLPAPELPVIEPVIADREDHRIDHQGSGPLPVDIKIAVPRYRLDLGELHCLSVKRGTLTAEERFLINHHIVQTIIMLRGLPFPDYLRAVTDMAGNHHEHLDGSGYPRGLIASELSLEARMMAIADIFEALTASDRPYKKGKPVSEALRLLAAYVRMGHLDHDLFELFMRAGVYQQFAQRFLDPWQIDEFDLEEILELASKTEA